MKSRLLHSVSWTVAWLALACLPAAMPAQSSKAKSPADASLSRWDIFAGYSYLSPHDTVDTTAPVGFLNNSSTPVPVSASYDAVNLGGLFSGSYYITRHVGVQTEFGEHEWGVQCCASNVGSRSNNDGFLTLGAGPIVRFPNGNFTPFVHALMIGARVNGPYFEPNKWGPGMTAGGGLDYETPWFNHHLAIRLFQADYEFMHANWGAVPLGGDANINAVRLSTGLVIHAGSMAPPPPVTLAVAPNPASVYPGEPIALTATAGSLNPKDNVIYSWSGPGVVDSDATTTRMNTTDLAPGKYTVTATVKEGKKGKEGLKPWETASNSTQVTVKEFEPPTISCAANPATIAPGATATVTSTAVSPQNRPLTYSYLATAGTVTGDGTTAEYSSAGAPTGAVGITCTVSDDKGHTAKADTSLTIVAPPVIQPKTQALCTLSFSTDKRRPTRVDNEAKACLDQVALDLKQQADAKAVLVGEQDSKEVAIEARQQKFAQRHKRAKVDAFAAQRAVNAKDYLVKEQGIDGSRVSVATGAAGSQTVENYLVPSGADFAKDVAGTTPVDETAVKPQVRKPLAQRHPARHKARKKAKK